MPLQSWEAVVVAGGRQHPSRGSRADALVHRAHPRRTDPGRVIGAKPAAFCWWLFDLLGALPGDELDDLFPGSGGVSRAWSIYTSCATSADAKDVVPLAERRDASRPAAGADASCLEERSA